MAKFPLPTELMPLKRREFWRQIAAHETEGRDAFYAVNRELTRGNTVSQGDAKDALAGLFIHSHSRIKTLFPSVADRYPTTQYTNPKRRDLQYKPLFWIDHFTGGVRLSSTLNWFSAMRLSDGSRPGASTHFVIGYHDVPYYIIPIEYCAWHARKKNKDSLGVEMVNAGPVHTENGVWHFHAGPIPQTVLDELIPRRINPPYKGASNYLPYTDDQVVNNLLLKRLVVAATGDQLAPERFTGHSDWQEGKKDPGPLWPMHDINDAVFENIPVHEYRFIAQHGDSPVEVKAPDTEDVRAADYPTPPEEDRSNTEDTVLWDTLDVQKTLQNLGFPLILDGIFGPKTKAAVRTFQRRWNNAHEQDAIKVDGIPGPITCARLKKGV